MLKYLRPSPFHRRPSRQHWCDVEAEWDFSEIHLAPGPEPGLELDYETELEGNLDHDLVLGLVRILGWYLDPDLDLERRSRVGVERGFFLELGT